MIPLPRIPMVIRDDYVLRQIDKICEHLNNLFTTVDRIRDKQIVTKSTCVYLLELFKKSDAD